MTNSHWLDKSPGWILPYEEAFIESLARTIRVGAKVINIGGAVGTSSAAIMRGLFHLIQYQLVSIDIEDCPDERETLRRQGMLDKKHFRQVIMDSVMFAGTLPKDFKLDMVFVDGSHEYKHVLEDIKVYSKRLKKGGLLVLHDYLDPKQEQVTQAIDKWRSYKANQDWIWIGQVLYTLALMKPGGNMDWADGRLDNEKI